jgi:hypothetical protein
LTSKMALMEAEATTVMHQLAHRASLINVSICGGAPWTYS